MSFYRPLTVSEVRRAEEHVLSSEPFPDSVMQQAARAVAVAAEWLVGQIFPPDDDHPTPSGALALIVAGSGGNGGDALYAGACLAQNGWDVCAVRVGSSVHERAAQAFVNSGGRFVTSIDEVVRTTAKSDLRTNAGGAERSTADAEHNASSVINTEDNASPEVIAEGGETNPWEAVPAAYSRFVLIDGIAGLGARGPLRSSAEPWISGAATIGCPVVAVDIPSGIDPDTGYAHTPHVHANATVTFGAFRRAHALNAECGIVLMADCGLREECERVSAARESADASLAQVEEARQSTTEATATPEWPLRQFQATRAIAGARAPEGFVALSDTNAADGRRRRRRGRIAWPASAAEPQPQADKYSGGVVGICAGSAAYPGAGIMSTTAAVRATSSMVRYVGECAREIVRACPEVVATPQVADAGRVQAWVVGSGLGVDTSAEILSELLGRDSRVPIIIDADAITAVAAQDSGQRLRELIRAYPGGVVMTPHAGECERLRAALIREGEAAEQPGGRDDLTAQAGGRDDAATQAGGREASDESVGRDAHEKQMDSSTQTAHHPALAADFREAPGIAVAEIARQLNAIVLLKGRSTWITDSREDYVVDAGSSWAATAGSGDVLAGLMGALVAKAAAEHESEAEEKGEEWLLGAVVESAIVHARAAHAAAQKAGGPISALSIAEAIPGQVAQ